MTTAAAKSLTKKIRDARNQTLELVVEAISKRVWLSMTDANGEPYRNWNDYADREFDGGIQISVSRHDRPDIVAQLHAAGASQRMIAGITGTTQQTVGNDIKRVQSERVQVTNNLSPGSDPEPPPLDVDEVPDTANEPEPEPPSADPVPNTSIGNDNREHPRATGTRPPKPFNLVAAAQKIGDKVDKLITAIDDLYDNHGVASSAEAENILATKVSYFFDMAEKRNLMPQSALQTH
ncbi:hypothetical protein [Mycobacterium asiaticum]|uniref:Uncharacterized protein n=1 Tax=Mycobacterium asiaticum TaxID=1790 RepID=A0A1A3KAC1_MYCAS|nr:hypothetical protein [Mycobacterium asiaticum]OBJ81990.1 hypothetical protein A5640_21910 [Mycobacterium asiaticum]